MPSIGQWLKWGFIVFFVVLMYRACNQVFEPDDDEPAKPAAVIKVPPPTLEELRKRLAALDPKKQPVETLSSTNTLIKYYPDSPEAIEAKKTLPELTAAAAARTQADIKAANEQAQKKAAEDIALAKRSLARLRKVDDDMQGVTFYEPNNNAFRSGTTFSIYMVHKKGLPPMLRHKWRYRADDWLFVENFVVKIDSAEPIKFGAGRRETEVLYGAGILEYGDIPLEKDAQFLVALMSSGKVVKIRFEGRTRYHDHVLSAVEKQGIKDVLLAQDALK